MNKSEPRDPYQVDIFTQNNLIFIKVIYYYFATKINEWIWRVNMNEYWGWKWMNINGKNNWILRGNMHEWMNVKVRNKLILMVNMNEF